MNLLWTSEEMVQAMHARPVGRLPQGVTGISIDTRTIGRGEAFFAIRGERFDGHDFVTKAMHAGAALAVVSEEKLVMFGNLQLSLLVVTNVLGALENLARLARQRSQARIVAVTGSVGKTSTKEMLRAALAACGKVHASAASHNNHWGVPLSLARMPQSAEYGVFEIGMNHAGEITPLARLVRPHVAIITAVAPAHLGAFRSVDDIARAKAEIFAGLERGGTAIINRDDRRFRLLGELAARAKVKNLRSFGARKGADFRLQSAELLAEGSVVEASIAGQPVTYRIGAPGTHFVANSLAVLGAAATLGADLAKCALALAGVRPEKGRGERHRLRIDGGEAVLIDESYNANPASMAAALAVLAATPVAGRGRRIAVLGDMLELGRSSNRLHRALKKPIETAGIDRVFLAGEKMGELARILHPSLLAGHAASAAELERPLAASLREGDVVMVKASLGSRFTALVESLLKTYPAVGKAVG